MSRPPKPLPTQRELRHLFIYCPATGVLAWRPRKFSSRWFTNSWNTRFAGKPAGTPGGAVSGVVLINGDNFRKNRIVWKLATNEEPTQVLVRNGKLFDLRLANLYSSDREATNRNRNRTIAQNNISGVRGVSWSVRAKRWKAAITVNGSRIHLGWHHTLASAKRARETAEIRYGWSSLARGENLTAGRRRNNPAAQAQRSDASMVS